CYLYGVLFRQGKPIHDRLCLCNENFLAGHTNFCSPNSYNYLCGEAASICVAPSSSMAHPKCSREPSRRWRTGLHLHTVPDARDDSAKQSAGLTPDRKGLTMSKSRTGCSYASSLIVAFGLVLAATVPSRAQDKVRIGVGVDPSYTSWWVAKDRGFF